MTQRRHRLAGAARRGFAVPILLLALGSAPAGADTFRIEIEGPLVLGGALVITAPRPAVIR